MTDLLIPFEYAYMVKAILVSGLIGGVCAFLSCFITLKGWSLMGDALSHAVVPGVSLAWLVGLPFSVGAFIAGVMAALTMGWLKKKSGLREDAVIGIVFTSWFALGLLLLSLYPSNLNLRTIIFGNILAISDPDILQVLIISGVSILVLVMKWRDLLLYCFDEVHARSLGLNTGFLHLLLLSLLAATAVAALQTVGACLVVAMLVTPGATAYLLTDRFGKMLVIATITGAACGLIGAYISYYINGSTGGCIVVLQTFVFLVALVFAPKHGLLNTRRQRRLAALPQTS
ncbi:metal ABC transporter permease [Brevifollis gellanilyticus]|uniref:Membrane protein n=1 Tax=Brevifollis gellanilyticus TaxID=748831 RepID=A0A512M446_9BACT|nr:metal ABC transporter permease [Brevifollis gellanilyticus]GEP41503.1 membrane protein [Brevifollis gellanilyticus]